jgi:hypothetical protein
VRIHSDLAGRTYTVISPSYLYNIALNSLNIPGYREKWCRILPARVLSSLYVLKIFIPYTNQCNLIPVNLVAPPDWFVLMDLNTIPVVVKTVWFCPYFCFILLIYRFPFFFITRLFYGEKISTKTFIAGELLNKQEIRHTSMSILSIHSKPKGKFGAYSPNINSFQAIRVFVSIFY